MEPQAPQASVLLAPSAAPGAASAAAAAGTIQSGIVKAWLESNGTGFIAPSGGGPDVFVRREALTDGRSLYKGNLVTFEVGWDPATNRPVAEMLVGASQGPPANAAPQPAAPPAAPPAAAAARGPAYGAGGAGASLAGPPSDGLLVSGLPFGFGEDALRRIFGAYGTVVGARFLPDNGRPDRTALVRMGDLAQAQWLVDNVNNNIPLGLSAPVGVRFAQKAAAAALPCSAGLGATPDLGALGALGAGDCPKAPEALASGLQSGKVKAWFDEKGFGFLSSGDGGADAFVHRRALPAGATGLLVGEVVRYEARWDPRRQKRVAVNVARSPGRGTAPAAAGVAGVATGGAAGVVAGGATQTPLSQLQLQRTQAAEVPLVIAGLPAGLGEEGFRAIFGPYGEMSSVELMADPGAAPGQGAGTAALVRVLDPARAAWLRENLDGNIPVGLQGPVSVRPAYAWQQQGAAAAAAAAVAAAEAVPAAPALGGGAFGGGGCGYGPSLAEGATAAAPEGRSSPY